jgi:hypothetical protein
MEMGGELAVQLVIGNGALRHALAAALASFGAVAMEAPSGGRDGVTPSRVISTTVDMTPDDCRHLSARGVVVVILATLPGSIEEARYRDAGAAAYLPMGTPSRALAEQLHGLLDRESPLGT